MCHAILKVSYHHDKARDLIEIERADEFETRLKEVMGRPGVSKVTIFHPHTTHEEVKRWETRTHNNQEKTGEEIYKDYVDASKEIYQEVPQYLGSGILEKS